WLAGAPDVVKRYRYHHAKYAIVDGRVAWIGSENFGNAGFPSDREGNRGWSVIAADAELAAILRNVFEADFDPRRPDSMAAREPAMKPLPSPPSTASWSAGPASEPRSARIVLAPDTTLDPEGILGLFAAAKERLSIDAFYLDELWRHIPNPFLEAAFTAARRGGSVRRGLGGTAVLRCRCVAARGPHRARCVVRPRRRGVGRLPPEIESKKQRHKARRAGANACPLRSSSPRPTSRSSGTAR